MGCLHGRQSILAMARVKPLTLLEGLFEMTGCDSRLETYTRQ